MRPTELGKLSVQAGDLVRVSSGVLYRVVDVSLGGTLAGVSPRTNYRYGRPTVASTRATSSSGGQAQSGWGPPVPEIVHQCRSCPWRVDCEPDRDIPHGRFGDAS